MVLSLLMARTEKKEKINYKFMLGGRWVTTSAGGERGDGKETPFDTLNEGALRNDENKSNFIFRANFITNDKQFVFLKWKFRMFYIRTTSTWRALENFLWRQLCEWISMCRKLFQGMRTGALADL